MCEFISWIEKTDKQGQTHLLYLTDEEVFSTNGKIVFHDCRDNDIIGHGAIRRFFKLSETSGVEREVRDFWNLELLPAELQAKLQSPQEFDKHWGKMFSSGAFQRDDLTHIICHAPELLAKKARQIRKQRWPI